MSDPLWGGARPSRPYGREPGGRPHGRDSGTPGAPRTPPAGSRTSRPDPGRVDPGWVIRLRSWPGGSGRVDPGWADQGRVNPGWADRGRVDQSQVDSRGSDPRRRDSGRGGRDSGPRAAGGNGWDPGPPAGRGGDPGADARTRQMPAARGVPGDGSFPRGRHGDRSARDEQRAVPPGRTAGSTQPTRTRGATTQPHGLHDGAARGSGRRRESPGRRNSPPPRGLGRWGALQGGLGVCVIVACAAAGAIATMVTRNAPGPLLGLSVVVGAVAAALAVRPRAGRMIFPVPVLSYMVAALLSGVVYNRSADSSKTALAIAAAQWIANGFFAMALATVLAVVIISVRWYLWRRGRPTTRDPGWPSPAGWPRPDRPDPDRSRPDGAPPGRNDPGWARTRWRAASAAAGLADRGGIRVSRGLRRSGESPRARGGRWPRGSGGSWRLGRSGLARYAPSSRPPSRVRTLQLFQRGVTEYQVLDAVAATEVDLRLGLVAVAVGRHHGAEPELVVIHHVPGRQRGHIPVAR